MFEVFHIMEKKMKETQTIAGISTAMNNSGIGIIRISGQEAFIIAQKIFRPAKSTKNVFQEASHMVHYGSVVDGEEMIDEVLMLVMKAPHTYTREDTIEIDCHGGVFIVQKILELIIKNGARPAEPGEFTKRAFLNGRIDLSQAEAVIELINSQNEFALKSSLNQLKGKVSEKISSLRNQILYQIAFIESALDDPEHISVDGYAEKLLPQIIEMNEEIKQLIESSQNGRIMSEGINTVIIGKPNVGKSSLLNILLGEDRAIVTDIEGTTRDVLEEKLRIGDICLNIIDTAGIRETKDIIEEIGVKKAKGHAKEADLILYVVDSSKKLDENDSEIIDFIKEKKTLVLLNKIDLETVITKKELEEKTNKEVLLVSIKENIGLKEFEKKIKDMFYSGTISFNDEIYITNVRHKTALINANQSLEMVKKSILDDMPEDFFSIDLMNAYAQLGMVIGEEVEEDLVNEIFSKFCMGK